MKNVPCHDPGQQEGSSGPANNVEDVEEIGGCIRKDGTFEDLVDSEDQGPCDQGDGHPAKGIHSRLPAVLNGRVTPDCTIRILQDYCPKKLVAYDHRKEYSFPLLAIKVFFYQTKPPENNRT